MEASREDTSHFSIAAQLLVLTGARSYTVRFARRDEFDLESGRWSLPDERMKTRQAFAIPLAPTQESPKFVRESRYVFPESGCSGVMRANSICNLLYGSANITRHGFRSTFRDWQASRPAFLERFVSWR